MSTWISRRRLPVSVLMAAALGGTLLAQQRPADQGFSFKSSVDLVSVNATVTDGSGHFVPNLRLEDFTLDEDGERQTITQFEAERVPVSLGIVLDTSGSMGGEKMEAAREALRRFVYDLLGQTDEMFLYRFDSRAILVQGWTEDRARLVRALGGVRPAGGTALYDAVAEAIPLAASGTRRKKALVVISDGNDTSSNTSILEVKQLIRETEVMVYAIGIDGDSGGGGSTTTRPPVWNPPAPPRIPLPFPIPGKGNGKGGTGWPPIGGGTPGGTGGGGYPRSSGKNDDRVNVAALRDMTDDSGGRTEIVRDARDLNPATANIADELSKQYYLGYPATAKKDGRWHSIRVELKNRNYRVRARRGYIAT
jgi:VWFA-related protein